MVRGYQLSDLEIQNRIQDRLFWDRRVNHLDVDVEVESGVATLSGRVDSAFRKNAVMEIVSRTEGVWSIRDFIEVPYDYDRSDHEIKRLIEQQFSNLDFRAEEFIEVEVADGCVKFEGEVTRPRLKAFAEGLAWSLSGVVDVLNMIEIVPPRHMPPEPGGEDRQSLFGLYNQERP